MKTRFNMMMHIHAGVCKIHTCIAQLRMLLREQRHRVMRLLAIGLTAVSGAALALMGGGLTNIGTPTLSVMLSTGDPSPLGWDGHSTYHEFSPPSPYTNNGGSLYREHLWTGTNFLSGNDFAAAYSDDKGTFWALAIHDIAGKNPEQTGVGAEANFSQSFIKDTENAYLRFQVTRAYQLADPVATGIFRDNWGVKSSIESIGILDIDATGESLFPFHQTSVLQTDLGAHRWGVIGPGLNPLGPMTYTLNEINNAKELIFDPYTGTIDISSIPIGGSFEVFFTARAYAEGVSSPEFPIHVEAYFRDPLSTGGGFSITTDGLTPLNKPRSGPIPRDRANAQAIQADGKIIVVGQAFVTNNYDFALVRYNSDGSLDTSFGTSGKVTTDISGNTDNATAVAIQSDGKIIVAGGASNGTNNDFALLRYNADGSLDTSFGTSGKVVLDFAKSDDLAKALMIQGDGKIVVAGSTNNISVAVTTNQDFALARFNADGTLDASFGVAGMVITDFANAADYVHALALQSDGKIVAAGSSDSNGVSKTDFALARYNTDGTLDTSFGTGGKVITDFVGASDSAQAIAIQGDGKIIAVGWAFNGTNNDFAMARYNTDGTLDTGCGGSGKVLRDFAGTHDEASAVAIQSDGKIVVGGNTQVGTQRDFAITRFTSFCSVDTNFGATQYVSADFAGKDDRIAALTIQGDGKIVATGYAATATGDDFAMLRLNP
jgi:uncharacterized delta-60 repeat protein